jgi:hypothetical protein
MSYFTDYLTRTDARMLTKWAHYFDVYDREFGRFRQTPISFLEIGVFRGGSIPMWKGYFAEGSTLVFIDIDPDCAAHADPGTHVEIGNQADPDFLARIGAKYGPFDVVLDDGSHLSPHQIASFEGLWPHMKDRSIYAVEDCHTSYWPGFKGGYRAPGSFIEFAKAKVDAMHSWYTDQDKEFPFDPIARDLAGVRFYDSIVIFEKQAGKEPPQSLTSRNGEVTSSRRALEVRGRRSAFAGKDGG